MTDMQRPSDEELIEAELAAAAPGRRGTPSSARTNPTRAGRRSSGVGPGKSSSPVGLLIALVVLVGVIAFFVVNNRDDASLNGLTRDELEIGKRILARRMVQWEEGAGKPPADENSERMWREIVEQLKATRSTRPR